MVGHDVQAAKRVWSVGLCEFHRDRALKMTAERCASHLAVSWPHGLAFEFSTTLLHRVAFSTNFTRHRSLESHVKLLISIVVAVASMSSASQGRTQGGGDGGLAPNGCMIVHN